MGKIVRLLLVGALVAFATSAANADYLISVVDNGTGLNSAVRAPGQSITLGVTLEGNPPNTHDSADFNVIFSRGGLVLTSFAWANPPFLTGGLNDFSDPKIGELPVEMTTAGAHFGANSNAFGTVFQTGTLVTLDLMVPGNWAPVPDSIEVTVQQGASFQDFVNFEFPETTVGAPFTLLIPEPATLALLGIGGLAALRRRRHA